jgi:hypothetical protein
MTQTRRHVSEKINSLGNTEHLEIYKILEENGIGYSENNNGIFFNLTTLDPSVFKRIEDFVNYCYTNKIQLDEYDKKLNECKYRNNIDKIVKVSTFQSSINEPLDKKERWKELVESVDKTEAVREFIQKIHTTVEKHSTKRSGTRYLLAKKKFSKKTVTETDVRDDLVEEDYIII